MLKQILELTQAIIDGDFNAVIKKIDAKENVDFEKILNNLRIIANNSLLTKNQDLNALLDIINAYANHDFAKKMIISNQFDLFDAISTGINILGEELGSSYLSRQEYIDTLNSLPYVVWSSNIDFSQIEYVNNGTIKIFGVSSEIMQEKPSMWVEIIHEEDRAFVETEFDHFFITGEFKVEYRIIHQETKEIRWITDQARFLTKEDGTRYRIVGSCQDITYSKHLELQQLKNFNRLEEAQRISKVGSWELDFSTNHLIWSKEHFDIFELDYSIPNDKLYDAYRSCIHPEDLTKLDPIIEHTVNTGEPFEYIHRTITKSGECKYIRGIGNAIINSRNEVIGIQGTAQDITEAIIQEEKLNSALSDLNAILDSTDYSIIATDLEGTITLFNQGAERILGYHSDEIINQTSPVIFHEMDEVIERAKVLSEELNEYIRPDFEVFTAKLTRLGISDTNEWTYLRKDGGKIPVLLTCENIKNQEGSTVGYIGIAKDITHDKNQQAQLNDTLSKLNSILDSSDYSIISTNLKGEIVLFNKGAEKMLGYSADEVVNKMTPAIIHDEEEIKIHGEKLKEELGFSTLDKIDTFHFKTRTTGLPDSNEWTYIHKNGTRMPVLLTLTAVKNNENEIIGYLGIAKDITQDKKQQEEILSIKKELQNFFDLSQDFMCIANLNGYFILVNKTFENELGWNESEILNTPFIDLIHEADMSATLLEVEKLSQGALTIDFENRYKTKSGEYIWISWRVAPDVTTGNLYCSGRNITTLKEQEKIKIHNIQLQKEKEVTEQKSKLKERFLANMSHEIRTPMNSIIGLSNLMEKVGTLNPKQMDYMKTIRLNSKNLLGIINDILDLSKIEEGKLILEQIPIQLDEIVRGVVKSLHLIAHKKRVELEIKIDERIPVSVIGDYTRLGQVLTNLINNAIKFTHEGRVTIELQLKEKTNKHVTIYFAIQDTGIGIKEDKLHKIFEAFTQETNSTTRMFGGTGLGLSIAQNIIQEMGGKIEVKSKENVGTTFYFTCSFELPEIEDITDVTFISTTTETNESIPLTGKYSILIVDDNSFNQMVAEDTLKNWNGEFEIDIAENGKEAISTLRKAKEEQHGYNLILMDLQMPEMDGYEATKLIRNELKLSTPIIAMTANLTKVELDKCLELGMNSAIAKPFKEEDLFEKVSYWLTSKNIL